MIDQKRIITNCSTADAMNNTMKLICDFWVLNIVDAIGNRELRFGEIEKSMPISPATLTNRLKKLEDQGVVVRHIETLDKQSVTYVLTPKGKDLLPIIVAIKRFSETHTL